MVATYPAPSETRDVMLAALKEAGRSRVIVAESVGIAGLKASVEAGLGVAAFSEAFVPQGLEVLNQDVGLPHCQRNSRSRRSRAPTQGCT